MTFYLTIEFEHGGCSYGGYSLDVVDYRGIKKKRLIIIMKIINRLSNDHIAEIEASANAATPGPWEWSEEDNWLVSGSKSILKPTVYSECARTGIRNYGRIIVSEDNKRFIAHARGNIPALIAEVKRLREERRWIPVSERLPEAYEDVLCTNQTDKWVSLGDRASGGMWRDARDSDCEIFPTHWMPLPKSPEGEKEE